jgi:hypothetical protein
MTIRTFAVALVVLLAAIPLHADIIHVPGDFPTIQLGIDAANEHDTVLVKPGLYAENISVIGCNIVLASLFLTTADTIYIFSTTIDGGLSGPVIMNAGLDTTAMIVGFTIQNGYSDKGAGIYCDYYSTPIISYNIIRENVATYYGGGVYCRRSEAIIRNNTICENFADYLGGGICCENANPEISHNHIMNNTSCFGGGIGCHDISWPTIRSNVIVGNTADP